MMKHNKITDLESIVDNFDVFIFDIWGVIHNGKEVYNGIIDKFTFLKNRNKKIIIASNSPRPASTLKKILNQKGLDESLYDLLMTSGEVFLHEIKNNTVPFINLINHPHAFIVDENIDDLNDELIQQIYKNFQVTDQIEKAEALIVFTVTKNKMEYERKYQKITEKALEHQIPFYCINSDVIVYENNDPIIRPGYWAGIYQQLGGNVIYYGKPHHKIYEFIFSLVPVPKDRYLMIGDSLNTDIKGAHKADIQSALVLHLSEKLPFFAPFPNYLITEIVHPSYFFPNWAD